MLDGILGRGFSSKCKSLIKPTRTRIDVLRKRKEATQRFLKGNLAQLLSNGLDINAFGRVGKQTEEYLAGLDLLFCYDFIEQSCEFVLKHLSAMQKIRECPEDCREAVGSLMFAAARFSDLPELRDLRDALQERYGGSLEHFVNQKFVEKLSLREPPTDKKIQLLQNIASEFSIKWDSRGFEQRMTNPSAFAQDQPKKYGIYPDNDNKYKSPIGKETDLRTEKKNPSKEKPEPTLDKHRIHGVGRDNLKKDEPNHDFAGREHLTANNRKPDMGTQQSTPRFDKYNNTPLPGRKQLADYKPEPLFVNEKEDKHLRRARSSGGSSSGKTPEVNGHGVHDESCDGVPLRAGWVPVSDGKDPSRGRGTSYDNYAPPNTASSAKKVQEEVERTKPSTNGLPPPYNNYATTNTASPAKKVQEEEIERTKPYTNGLPPPYTKSKDKQLPPPYIKSKDSRYGVHEEAKKLTSDQNEAPMVPPPHREESDHSNYRDHGSRHARTSSRDGNKDSSHGDEVSLPKPRASVDPTRQKRESDSPRFDDDSSFVGKIPLPKPRSIRKKHSKSSSSRDRDDFTSFEDDGVRKRSGSSRRRDNSRKGLQILFDDEQRPKDEEERVIDRLLMHYSKKPTNFDPEKLKRKSKPRADVAESSRDAPEDVSHPPRSVSLPRGQIVPPEPVKVFTRANSFQPDNPARHVHPKLPDYDDLAARFAALRGR